MNPAYVYKVIEVVKVTDGDTYWLRVDIGFRQSLLIDCRLNGWDCPEIRKGSDHEKAEAKEAKVFAEAWFRYAASHGLYVQTFKSDDFGRWLGSVWTATDDGTVLSDLGEYLSDNGFATKWPTRWHEVYDQ